MAKMMIGGQALVEGVLLKTRYNLVSAVRTPSGKIKVRHKKEKSKVEQWGLEKIPLVRGTIILFETLYVGIRELQWSAGQAAGEDERLTRWEIALTLFISLLFAVLLFKLFPLFLASWITGKDGGNWTLNILDGLIKFGVFIGYILAISMMRDVRRLFQYHGAEHKSVNCYETGKKVTVKSCKPFTTKQPRCGTTFVTYVFLLSILLYLLIPFGANFWMKYLLRLLFLPVIAGLVFEWIRIAGKWHDSNWFVRALSGPGKLVQFLTLREPDKAQQEVAVAAMERLLKEEKKMKKNSKKTK